MADRSYVVELDLRKKGDFKLDEHLGSAAKYDQAVKAAREYEATLARIHSPTSSRALSHNAKLAQLSSPEHHQTLVDKYSSKLAQESQSRAQEAQRSFDRMREGVSHLSSAGSGFVGMLDSAVGKAANLAKWIGVVGGGAALGAITYGVVGLNAQLESATTSLGTILRVQGQAASVPQGLQMASGIIKDMRVDAQKLPGEFEDLFNIYLTGAGSALKGLDPKQWEVMAGKVMVAAKSSSVDMGQAAREFAQLLEGHAGSHNVFGGRAFNLTGKDAQKFNALGSVEERTKALTPLLDKFGEGIESFSKTYDAASSTFVGGLKDIGRAATAPLFANVTSTLNDLNDWFFEHRSQVSVFASHLGAALSDAFMYGRAKFEEYWPILVRFADVAETRIAGAWKAIAPYAERFESAVKGALEDPNGTIDKLVHLGELYLAIKGVSLVGSGALGALRLGGAVNSIAGGGMNAFGSAVMGGSALGEGAAAAGGMAGLAAGAATAGAALTLLASAGSAAYMVYEAKKYGDALHASDTHDLNDQIGGFIGSMKDAGLEGEAIQEGLRNRAIAERQAAESSRGWTSVNEAGMASTHEWIAAQYDLAAATENAASALERFGGYADAQTKRVTEDATAFFMAAMTKTLRGRDHENEDPKSKQVKHPGGGGGTHIGKIEFTITSNENPDRIAQSIIGKLDKAVRQRGTSRRTTDYSNPNGSR